MYQFIVGIDVSKEVIDVSFRLTSKVEYLGQFKNDQVGFGRMIEDLKKSTFCAVSKGFICFENTGVYSKLLLEYLIEKGVPCREENPIQIKRSMGLKRGKTDAIDSRSICIYAYEKRETLEHSKLTEPIILKLKKLLSYRDLLVKQKVALQISIKESSPILDDELKEFLVNQNTSLLTKYREQIKAIELEVQKTIGQNTGLNRSYELVQSIKGIGPIIGAYLIAFTDNFRRFSNARKFACYCGIAPFPNQSGKFSGKTKVSHMANKKIKSLLSNAVPVAVRFDPQIKRYQELKLKEGKPRGVIVNNIKNKLIQRVFAVINRQTHYVVLQ